VTFPQRLTLVAAIAVTVLSVDWLTKYAAAQFAAHAVVRNPATVHPLLLPAILVFVVLAVRKVPARMFTVAFGLTVGGAVANLIDRMAFGPVTDFIALPDGLPFGWGDYVANVADLTMIVGAALMWVTTGAGASAAATARLRRRLAPGADTPPHDAADRDPLYPRSVAPPA
jgi:lipoprotein signal peptidase